MHRKCVVQNISHPEFFPPETTDIQEPAAIDMINRMERMTVNAASLTCPVETAYIGPAQAGVPSATLTHFKGFLLHTCNHECHAVDVHYAPLLAAALTCKLLLELTGEGALVFVP